MIIELNTSMFGHESPWSRGEWYGQVIADPEDDVSRDGILTVTEADVSRVLAGYNGASSYWECSVSGLVQLRDGRYMAWMSNVDVTGSGFHADAYGGDANIHIGSSPDRVMRFIPEFNREQMTWSTTEAEAHVDDIMWDAWLTGKYLLHEIWLIGRNNGITSPEFRFDWVRRTRITVSKDPTSDLSTL